MELAKNVLEFLTPGSMVLLVLVALYFARLMAKKFLPKAELDALVTIATIAVESVEQLAKNGKLDKNDRRKIALNLIVSELNNRGMNLSLDLVRSAIESAVLQVNVIKPIEIEGVVDVGEIDSVESAMGVIA